jgi:hypothetical protein
VALLLVVLTCRRSPPTLTPMIESIDPDFLFPTLHMDVSGVFVVSKVCCCYFLWMLQK